MFEDLDNFTVLYQLNEINPISHLILEYLVLFVSTSDMVIKKKAEFGYRRVVYVKFGFYRHNFYYFLTYFCLLKQREQISDWQLSQLRCPPSLFYVLLVDIGLFNILSIDIHFGLFKYFNHIIFYSINTNW